ncbi:MAG TPA: hypothetical protein V6D17_14205 [Candidatus Obscuribacterales bacterium]
MTDEVAIAKADKLNIDEALASGWDSMKASFWPLLGIMAVNGLFAMVPSVIGFFLGTSVQMSLESILISLALAFGGLLLAVLIEAGMINVQLRILDQQKVKSDDVYRCYPFVWKYLGAAILYRFACGLGYLCFIVPGIIVQLSFQYFGYFIIERKMGPIQALKASWAITDGCRFSLLLFGIIQYFINWLGMLCFLIGAIPAGMVTMLAQASAYRQLVSRTPELAGAAHASSYAEGQAAEQARILAEAEGAPKLVVEEG